MNWRLTLGRKKNRVVGRAKSKRCLSELLKGRVIFFARGWSDSTKAAASAHRGRVAGTGPGPADGWRIRRHPRHRDSGA